MRDLTAEEMNTEVLARKRPALVEFWTPWCLYSLLLKPKTEALDRQYGDRMIVGRLNIETQGGRGRTWQADVSKSDEVQSMFQGIYKEHKRVDILVNNAGITRDEMFITMRRESWEDLLRTNLNAVFFCCKAVIRTMCAA